MGRHKKEKLNIPDQYVITARNIPHNMVQVSKRVRNGIKELHNHIYYDSAGFMDLKFFMERELHYMKRRLEEAFAPIHDYITKSRSEMMPYQAMGESITFLTEIVRHLPEQLWIKVPTAEQAPSYKRSHYRNLWNEYEYEVVNRKLTPLSEKEIIELEEHRPDYINKDYTPLYQWEWSKRFRLQVKYGIPMDKNNS